MFYEVSKSVIVWIVAPDTLFGERKNRTEDQIYVRRRLTLWHISFVQKQASVATAASQTTEVSGLRQSVERAEGELGRVKKQLEDNQGMQKTLSTFSVN